MNILTKLQNDIFSSFSSDNEKTITTHEETALKNLIAVAKERIWLADPIHANEYDTFNFEEEISSETIEKIKKSIKISESLLENRKN
jgi:hypothetical protein